MPLRLYGIKNCDTIKKARAWLESAGVAHEFHDYRAAGIDRATLERWCRVLGWESVINRAGTTFRKLPESDKARLDESCAIALMLAMPALIRRPIAEGRGALLAGFSPETYRKHFST